MSKILNWQLKFSFIGLALFLIGSASFPSSVLAADLRIITNKTNVAVGEMISVRIVVSSPEQSANALSGVLNFDEERLQVTSLSKASSVVNLWVTEPEFSNLHGQVSFEGAILNPGFVGGAGTVLTVNFKAKASGSANLSFINGQVLANDGAGTSILKKLGQTTLIINKAEVVPVVEKEENVEQKVEVKKPISVLPETPLISSPTHVDQDKWYNNRFPKFEWKLGDDITDVSYVFNSEKNTSPQPRSLGLFDNYTVENPSDDGLWYFHLRLKNSKGWSQTSHFAVKIDTTIPSQLTIQEKVLADINYKTSFIFDGADELSGIGEYEFVVDELKPEVIIADKAHIYETPALSSGKHLLIVRAVDLAGNKLEKKIEFNIISPLTRTSLFKVGDSLVVILSVLVPLVLLILALIYVLVVGWRRLSVLKRSLRKEVDEVEDHIHEAFDFIRKDLHEQVKLIQKTKGKRKLTLLEAKIMRKLRTNLNETEKYIKKDIEDITDKI